MTRSVFIRQLLERADRRFGPFPVGGIPPPRDVTRLHFLSLTTAIWHDHHAGQPALRPLTANYHYPLEPII